MFLKRDLRTHLVFTGPGTGVNKKKYPTLDGLINWNPCRPHRGYRDDRRLPEVSKGSLRKDLPHDSSFRDTSGESCFPLVDLSRKVHCCFLLDRVCSAVRRHLGPFTGKSTPLVSCVFRKRIFRCFNIRLLLSCKTIKLIIHSVALTINGLNRTINLRKTNKYKV